jgi:outer membrane protein assembly factor BamC
VLLACSLAACSSIENFAAGDKVDYRTTAVKTPGLEVPPDLTQLARDSRYQAQGGTISAAAFQAGGAASAPAAIATVAPKTVGDMKIERAGNQRWLTTAASPETLWPQLEGFWKDNGFALAVNQANVGVMETEWAENRAKLPKDLIRSTLGKLVDSLYETGERDKFRTRIERTASGGSEVYVSHRGLMEVYGDKNKDTTVWQPRPADPDLEAEMLQRLMLKLGAKEESAKAAVAGASAPAAGTATVGAQAGATTLQLNDSFDRAWRRVGLALDRSGFTVEDRDRKQGLYFVRYVDPALVGKEEPGFFSKLLSFGSNKDERGAPARYRVSVKSEGDRSTVSVQTSEGAPESGEAGKRIIALLAEDLK